VHIVVARGIGVRIREFESMLLPFAIRAIATSSMYQVGTHMCPVQPTLWMCREPLLLEGTCRRADLSRIENIYTSYWYMVRNTRITVYSSFTVYLMSAKTRQP
jgi:hypothetical protein